MIYILFIGVHFTNKLWMQRAYDAQLLQPHYLLKTKPAKGIGTSCHAA
jgi:hypothetical protein